MKVRIVKASVYLYKGKKYLEGDVVDIDEEAFTPYIMKKVADTKPAVKTSPAPAAPAVEAPAPAEEKPVVEKKQKTAKPAAE